MQLHAVTAGQFPDKIFQQHALHQCYHGACQSSAKRNTEAGNVYPLQLPHVTGTMRFGNLLHFQIFHKCQSDCYHRQDYNQRIQKVYPY